VRFRFEPNFEQTIPEHRSVGPEIANTEYFYIAAAARQADHPGLVRGKFKSDCLLQQIHQIQPLTRFTRIGDM
jgi:hypothetical protein